jgi:hypothetical protein
VLSRFTGSVLSPVSLRLADDRVRALMPVRAVFRKRNGGARRGQKIVEDSGHVEYLVHYEPPKLTQDPNYPRKFM